MASFDLLQPRRDALQAQYDALSEKLLRLRRQSAIEAGVSIQFQMEKEIEQAEADLDRIGQQQEDLERLSGYGRLYQALLKLGYRKQVQTFRKFVQGFPVSAFLIHGGMDYGQRWLLNRLVVQHTQDSITGKVVRINLTRVARKSDVAALWRELGGRVGLGRQGSIAEIIDRIYQWWQTQHVLLIFYEVDELPESFLEEMLRGFWQPLVGRGGAMESPYRLLMFLVDYDGCVGDWAVPFVEQPEPDWTSVIPVKLAKIAEFSDSELGSWLDVFSSDLPLGFSEEIEGTVQVILENSDAGVPEPAMGEICRMAGSDWYENEDRWLKL
jgi:inactive STAND